MCVLLLEILRKFPLPLFFFRAASHRIGGRTMFVECRIGFVSPQVSPAERNSHRCLPSCSSFLLSVSRSLPQTTCSRLAITINGKSERRALEFLVPFWKTKLPSSLPQKCVCAKGKLWKKQFCLVTWASLPPLTGAF